MRLRSLVIRLDTPDPVRLWSGHGPLAIPADRVEPVNGALYRGGAGFISGFEEIDQLINGLADRLEITVSGINDETMAIYVQERDGVIGAALDVGTVDFNDGWQITAVTWQARYRADKIGVTRQEQMRTITLSLGTDDTGRSRSRNAYWTPADQRRRYGSADDAIFDLVTGINAGTSRVFAPNG